MTRRPSATTPALDAEPGWTELAIPALYNPAHSFVSGDQSERRLQVRYYRHAADPELLAKVWFGPGCEGPPGHAHGGSVCAVMDEAMGGCAWLNGHPVLAARVTVNFRKPVPLGTTAWLRASLTQVHGRKIHTRGVLTTAHEAELFADAEGLFVVIERDKLPSADPRVQALFEHAHRRRQGG